MLQATLQRSLQRLRLASLHRSGKCTTARKTQAVRGLPENKQNSDNRKKVFIRAEVSFHLGTVISQKGGKKLVHRHTLDSSLDGRALPGAQRLKLQMENSAQQALSALFYLPLMTMGKGVSLLRKVQRICTNHSLGIYPWTIPIPFKQLC